MKTDPHLDIALEDRDLYVAIAYAGASQYPWWTQWDIADIDDLTYPASAHIAIDARAHCEDIEGHARVTVSQLRKAIAQLWFDHNAAIRAIDWNDPECDTDIDADVADQIMQQAVLGGVSFS